MRVFIAIDIDGKTKDAIADVQKQLKAKVDIKKGDLKWVEPQNIHLTLKFLGEIDDLKLTEIQDITKHTAEAHKNFMLDIESVGSFEGRRGRVVWIGAGKGADELITLQKDLDSRLEQAGYPKEEREFSAHLTICRVRNPRTGFKLVDAAKQFAKFKFGSVDANAVCIYQSQLTPEGPIYTQLASFKMA